MLLLDQFDRRAHLYFRGSPADPEDLLDALTVAHDELMSGWRSFDRYLNSSVPRADLLTGPGGLVDSGPSTVLAVYDAVLRARGVESSVLDLGVAKHRDDHQRIELEGDCAVVFLSGWNSNPYPGPSTESYVIAGDIDVRQIAGLQP